MDYLCICLYNVEYLANYDSMKLIVTSPAILELLIVDIYIISKAPAHTELPNFENLRVSQLICTPMY